MKPLFLRGDVRGPGGVGWLVVNLWRVETWGPSEAFLDKRS